MSHLRDLARAKANLCGHGDVRTAVDRALGDGMADKLDEARLDDGTPVLREPGTPGYVLAHFPHATAPVPLRVYARLGMGAAEWHPISELADLAHLEPVKKLPSRGPVS